MNVPMRRAIRTALCLLIATLVLALWAVPAQAASCPYCGRSYGSGPSGSSYISSIRAQHESSCSARWSTRSGGGGGGGNTSSWQRAQAEAARQAALAAARERARIEAERRRRERERRARLLRRVWERQEYDMKGRLIGVLDVMPSVADMSAGPVKATPEPLPPADLFPPITSFGDSMVVRFDIPSGKEPTLSPEFLRAQAQRAADVGEYARQNFHAPWAGLAQERKQKVHVVGALKDLGKLMVGDVVSELAELLGVGRAWKIYSAETSLAKDMMKVIDPSTTATLGYGGDIGAIEARVGKAVGDFRGSVTSDHHATHRKYSDAFGKVLTGAELDLTGGAGFNRPSWWPPI